MLGIELPWLNDINRPASTRRVPSVLTKDEVAGLLTVMEGETALLARLLHGTGMRLMEGMRLRIKDVDFDRHVIIVREAKGNKDRVVMLPRSLAPTLRWRCWPRVRAGRVQHHDPYPYPCPEDGSGRHGQSTEYAACLKRYQISSCQRPYLLTWSHI